VRCTHHTGASSHALCPLQQLADHTITVTQARAPHVACAVLVLDAADPLHNALGSSVEPDTLLALLEHHASRLRSVLHGSRCAECGACLLWSQRGALPVPFCPRCAPASVTT
jgi:hypothetical protein